MSKICSFIQSPNSRIPFLLRLEQRKLVSLVYNLAALLPQVRDLPPDIAVPLYDVLPKLHLDVSAYLFPMLHQNSGCPCTARQNFFSAKTLIFPILSNSFLNFIWIIAFILYIKNKKNHIGEK